MDIRPIRTLKATMLAVLRAKRENRRSMVVVSKGSPQAVLQDVPSYKGAQAAIALLKKMEQSENSVSSKIGSSTKGVFARLRARVRSRAGTAAL